ncbi:MAG: NADH-quinone oxidoreductase subunit A [Betaproteobacteria bacterium]|nr:NADH-quinone oxidoreductase subunit A [Betaproteobacteria bacterium]
MLANYFPILLFVLVGLAVGILPVVAGRLIAPHRPDAEKISAYECGFEAFGDARMPFDVRYYLIAIIFILFDLEIAFLFPWAAVFKDMALADGNLGLFGFAVMTMFLVIILVGDAYAWAKGALDWE